MRAIADRPGAGVLLVVIAVTLTACSDDPGPPPAGSPTPAATSAAPSGTSPGLESYTDTGDACEQAVSAIAYADDVLKPLGQEPYQDFDDAVRSRLAAVAGTLALEAKDWPGEPVHRQADTVRPLARDAAAPVPDGSTAGAAKRVDALLRYRIEAGRLVLACRRAAGP